jgi:hypothetical protein
VDCAVQARDFPAETPVFLEESPEISQVSAHKTQKTGQKWSKPPFLGV